MTSDPIDFGKLVTIHERQIDPSTLLFTEKAREWCRLPYPGHPTGCPNHCEACKRKAADFEKEIKRKHDFFTLVWAEFDFKTYKELRRRAWTEKQVTWTEKQVACLLYWQKSVLKILVGYILAKYPTHDVLYAGHGFKGNPSMEAAGIFVMGTLARNHVTFEIKPVNKVMMVTLVMHSIFGQRTLI